MWKENIIARLLATSLNTALIGAVLTYVFVEGGGDIPIDGSRIAGEIGDMLAFALLTGLASYATIEILKRVFALRGRYQLRQTRLWLTKQGHDDDDAFNSLLRTMRLDRGRREELRVFNMPTEQLAAQISTAADLALTRLASARDDKADLPFLVALTGLPEEAIRLAADVDTSPPPIADPRRYGLEREAQASELAARVRGGVDQLQISLGERWRGYVQGAALWISGGCGIVLVQGSAVPPGEEARYVLAALIVGGVFAWLARDLAAVVERARR